MRPTLRSEAIPEGAVVLWVECIVKPQYREAFLECDPENPAEFIKRVLDMLADQLSE